VILTNLLPGLRELRAPLIAGYLWLIAAWFAAQPFVPEKEPSDGIGASAVALHDIVSFVGTAAASAVAAYLVGSLSEGLLSRYWRRERGYGGLLFTAPVSERGTQAVQSIALREAECISRMFGKNGTSMSSVLGQGVPSTEMPTVAQLMKETRVQVGNATGTPETVVSEREAEIFCAVVIRTSLENERDLLATRLIGEEPELYGSIDRLRAESDLRFQIGPPVIALGTVLTVRTCSLLWLLILLAVGVFWHQGSVRSREANDLVFDALVLSRVKSPTLERVREELKVYEASANSK
jgi:hypothetical protein